MRGSSLVYFDHAATSYPKPPEVVKAVTRAFSAKGGNPGRSSHELSRKAAEAVYECREAVCGLLGFDGPERIVFTQNTTHALNAAIKGTVSPDSHTVITNLEHNSVIRPLHALKRVNGSSYSVIDALADDDVIIENFKKAIRPNTKTAVITMASNVCGKIMPTAAIARICHDRGITLIVDGAQAIGCVPVSFDEIGCDILCSAGHKGLYGPQGTGFMAISERVVSLATLMEGGSGVNSEDTDMPHELPERLEAGTLNTPGICGLSEGIKYVVGHGIESIYEKNLALADYLADGLENIEGVKLYGRCEKRTPVALFNIDGLTSDETAGMLDEKHICVRSGLHCAPLAHAALKTGDNGAVRASLSFSNTKNETDYFLKCVSDISKSAKK